MVNSTRTPRRPLDGVLLLDKPSGVTSNAALQRARRAFNAAKAGHTGTLDPLASGLLPLCFGEATKFSQGLLDATKRYTATVRFGVTTTTQDAEGATLATRAVALTRGDIEAALPAFTGTQQQLPPAFSALKFDGRKYYDYARAGVAIPRIARGITIHELTMTAWQTPDAVLDIVCSKGTYVRTLASDLGDRLGCGAHLAGLRRTGSGAFSILDAVPLATLETLEPPARDQLLLPPEVLLSGLPRLELTLDHAERFCRGIAVPAAHGVAGRCAVFATGALLGLAEVAEGRAQPRRLVATRSGRSG